MAHLGIEILAGANQTGTATAMNATVTTTNVEEIILNLGNAGDTVNLVGDLHGVGVATNTVTVNGGTGNDTVNASGLTGTTPIDVVFNGGGGTDTFRSGPGNDTFTDTGKGAAIYTETLNAGEFSYGSGHWTVTTGSEGTDTLQGVSTVTNGDGHHFLLVSADSQYTTIQAAINAASAGDTVLVSNGTYDENVTLKDGVSLVGLSESGVVIDGSMTAPATMSNMTVSSLTVENGTPTSMLLDLKPTTDITNVTFSNVTFSLTSDFTGEVPIGNGQVSGTIALHGTGLAFDNVTMNSNDHNFANSVSFVYTLFQTDPGAKLLLDGVDLEGTASGSSSGLGAQWNMSPQDSTTQNAAVEIINSHTSGGGNFYLSGLNSLDLENNVFDGQGVALNGVTNATVSGNTFENIDGTFTANGTQHRGLVIEDAFGSTGDSNIQVTGNTFSNITEPDGAIALQRFTDGSPANLATIERLADLFIENNTFNGLGPSVNPIYVNPTYFGTGAVVPASFDDGQLIIGTTGNDILTDTSSVDTTIVGGPGNDTVTAGSGNDTIIYNVGDGNDTVTGGAGVDTEVINDNGSVAQTFEINPITPSSELGVNIAATGSVGVGAATTANAAIEMTSIQEIVINLGSGGDTVVLSGDLHGTGVASSTVTVNGGTGNDTVDASGMTGTPVDIVFNGGGGNDTVVFSGNSTGYAFSVSGNSLVVHGAGVTDTLSGVGAVKFADATVLFVDNGTGAGHYNYAFTTIGAALAAAASITGPVTIEIAAGTYHENVNLTQSNVTLVGQGDSTVIEGTFKSSNGIADGGVATFLESGHSYTQTAGSGVTLSGSNDAIQNLKIDSFTYGVSLTDGINGDSVKNVDFTDNLVGIHKGTTAGITNFTLTGGSITDGLIGIDFDKTTAVGQQTVGMADNVTIDGTSFSNLAYKGIYLETLSDGTITNVTMDNVGQFGAPSTSNPANPGSGGDGIDLNLKNGSYSNDTIENFHLTDTGASNQNGAAADDAHGGAIVVEARNDGGTYSLAPASYTGAVTIENGTIDGTTSTGIQAGEPGQSNVYPNVTVTGVTITGADDGAPLHGDIANVTGSTFTMTMAPGDNSLLASPTTSGNLAITANSASDTITGGGGTDSVAVAASLTTASFSFDAAHGNWVVSNGVSTDTLHNIESVQDGSGHRFLLVGGGSQYATIQSAIDAAHAGDTILIAPGTYTETSQYVPGNFQGLHINTADLTLQGYSSHDGTAITTAAQAALHGPTVIAGAQNDFGANDWIDQGGSGATIEGLHLEAGAATDNKLIEITTDNVTIKNDFIDTFVNGTDTGAAAIYIDNQGTAINSYLIDHNILNEGIYVANGTGTAANGISVTEVISNNEFQGTFDTTSGLGRYDMVAVQGTIPGSRGSPIQRRSRPLRATRSTTTSRPSCSA